MASENDGIVVSNDNYRDLATECTEYKRVIEERVLMFSFVNDRFMPPDDPLGRSGPTLDNFLRIQPKYVKQLVTIYHCIESILKTFFELFKSIEKEILCQPVHMVKNAHTEINVNFTILNEAVVYKSQ